jgi:Rrf2 family iron-sulfur cluster assembly transcriptional regulator
MFRLYSRGCEYAIRAMVAAVLAGGDKRFLAKEVCREAGIPESFTRKVFQSLVQGEFLEAVRGPGGGYVLTRDPSQVSVYDVIVAVDGEDTFEHCILGLPQCGGSHACPLHEVWSRSKEHLLRQLRDTSVQDLAETGRATPSTPQPEETGRLSRKSRKRSRNDGSD